MNLVNEILDECEIMGKDFSNTSVALLRIGLAQRRYQELKQREEIEEEAKERLRKEKEAKV
jgi:hypothetical protein